MQDLNDLAYFVHVADHRGFAPAARALGMQKSKLSRRIAALEARLGVRLIQRSTRRFAVTEIGNIYYQHCLAMLTEAEAAQQAIDQASAEPRGLIRMACPPGLLSYRVSEAVASYMAAFPRVEIRLKAFNRPVDVIQEGLDIAICAETPRLDVASLAMRRLGEVERVLVAAPALLGRLGPIDAPADLKSWPALDLDMTPMTVEGRGLDWRFDHAEGAGATVSPVARMATDDLSALRAAACAGIGAAILPRLMIDEDLRAGRLVAPLPAWRPPPTQVLAIFPTRRGLLPSMRALLDHLADECAPYRDNSS
ncbi:MAG: LysR substrate-binding domain-containing protein [Pikeienuella sp.]